MEKNHLPPMLFSTSHKEEGINTGRSHREFGGVILQTKFQATPKCRMKRHKSVEFLSIFECQAPLNERKGPIENILATVLIKATKTIISGDDVRSRSRIS